jgi:hypothetical protein
MGTPNQKIEIVLSYAAGIPSQRIPGHRFMRLIAPQAAVPVIGLFAPYETLDRPLKRAGLLNDCLTRRRGRRA